MDEKRMKLYDSLVAAFMEWCVLFLKGSNSPVWTDGRALNYVRDKIARKQNEMIAEGYWIPSDFAELPPEMDISYMRDRERIETEAKQALRTCVENEDYQYIKENSEFFIPIQLASMRVEPQDVLEPVRLLQKAIEEKNFPAMRRYSDVEKICNLMKACRAEMEEEIEDMVPF